MDHCLASRSEHPLPATRALSLGSDGAWAGCMALTSADTWCSKWSCGSDRTVVDRGFPSLRARGGHGTSRGERPALLTVQQRMGCLVRRPAVDVMLQLHASGPAGVARRHCQRSMSKSHEARSVRAKSRRPRSSARSRAGRCSSPRSRVTARSPRLTALESSRRTATLCVPLDCAVRCRRPMSFPGRRSDGRISAVRRRDRSRVRRRRWRPGHVRRSPCPSTHRTSPCPS